MPPIKRNAKSAAGQPVRRLAGHSGPSRPQSEPAPTGRTGVAGLRQRRKASKVGKVGKADEANRARKAPKDTKASRATTGDRARSAAGERPGRGRAFGRPLAYAALVVGVVAGAAGGVLATVEPGLTENEAYVDRETTDEVLSAASTGVQRLVAIDHESLDEYHASLGEFLTPNLVDELNENWPTLRDSYEQTATAVDANVSEAGVAYLSEDSAEVLLVQDVSMTRDGAAAGSTSGTYMVGMDKVDGVWKLSRIPDLPS